MGCVSSKKKLSKADLEFLQDNTEFTKEQIIEWYEGFIVSTNKKFQFSSNHHMLHQHYKIAFPVLAEDSNWLIFKLLMCSIHAFLLSVCRIFPNERTRNEIDFRNITVFFLH